MMVHMLVSIFVILSFSDNVYVYSCKRGPSVSISPKIRTNIRTGINKAPLLKERSWYKRNLGGSSVKPPRGNRNGHGVYLGGYYADNLRMKIMFAQGAPRKISKFHKIDIDELAVSRALRDQIKKGELVSVARGGYTSVKTKFYIYYGTSSEFYDDDTDIFFDIYKVDTTTNQTSHRNATLKHIQVRQCMHSLRVSKSNPQLLLYACYKWQQSPYVILWIPGVMLVLVCQEYAREN